MGSFRVRSLLILAVCCFMLVISSAAFAENRAGAFTVSPFVGKFMFDKHVGYEDDLMFGAGLGYNFTKVFATEVSYARVNTDRLDNLGNKVEGDLSLYRLEGLIHLMPDSCFVPFLAIGGGLFSLDAVPGKTGRDNDAAADYGAGFKYFFNPDVALRADVRHILNFKGADEEYDSNWFWNAGLTVLFGGAKKAEPAPVVQAEPAPVEPAPVVVPVAPKDTDGDGVIDDLDKCPDTPKGVAVDKDGCPLDSDGDGVADYLDKCPDTPAGTKVDATGCPIPEKATVTEAGTYDFGIIYFDFNKAVIKPQSKPVLANVVEYLEKNPNVKLEVEGHTDSVGPDAVNMKLSDARAKAVKSYLVGKGIAADRLGTKGFGETRPAATNKTKDGRAKNRRIEFLPIQ